MSRFLSGIFVLAVWAAGAQAALVSGHVTDAATQLPIANASVAFIESPFGPLGSTNTDNDGFYELNVPSGSGNIGADASGYLPLNIDFQVDTTPQTIDFALQRSSLINGTVTDGATAQSIPYANVLLLDASTNDVIGGAQADEDGNYTFADIQPGQYGVCVIDPDDAYRDACYSHMVIGADGVPHFTVLNVSAGITLDSIDIALSPGATINGTLTDRYFLDPIANQTMQFTLYTPDRTQIATGSLVTGGDGSYTISGLAPGDYYLKLGAYFRQFNTNEAYNPTLYGGDECLQITCSFATAKKISVPAAGIGAIDLALFPVYVVTGKVTDAATGTGIPNVTVHACDTPFFVGVSASAVTDANGNYVLGHVIGAQTGVQTEDAPGYLNEAWPHTLVNPDLNCLIPTPADALSFTMPDQVLTHIDFALSKGAAIVGYVGATQTNEPLAATVAIVQTEGSSLHVVRTLTANADGTFQVIGDFDGVYYVMSFLDTGEDCQVYQFASCGDQWNVLDPTSADFSHAIPLTLSAGDVASYLDLNLKVDIFVGTFE